MKFKFSHVVAGFMTASVLAVSGTSYAAGSASFSVAGATTVDTGTDISFTVSENGGTNVTAVTTTFSYDTSKLQLLNTSCAGTFPNKISPLTCYVNPGDAGVNGSAAVATLTFATIAAGNASITITGSQIAGNGANEWNGANTSTSVTINTPAVTTPSQPASSAPTSSTTSSPSTTSSSKTATPATTSKSSSSNTVTTPTATTSNGQVKGDSTTTATPTTKKSVKDTKFKFTSTELITTPLVLVAAVAAVMAYLAAASKKPVKATATDNKPYVAAGHSKSKAKKTTTTRKKK